MTESAAWAVRVSAAAARRARVVGFRIIFFDRIYRINRI
jgi:hypothetical protein